MDNLKREGIAAIQYANKEMLDYFNQTFLEHLEEIQDLKTQSFEIDIKIDELEKTKDLYAFKKNSRKSVFTPIISDGIEDERGKIINQQIDGLKEVKDSLITKLRSLEIKLNRYKKKLAILNDAEEAIKALAPVYSSMSSTTSDTEGFEFIEEPDTVSPIDHGHNILMQDAFDKAFLSTLMDKNIKDPLLGVNNKLEMISYLLGTDISRAKLTLKEILHNTKEITEAIDDINLKLTDNVDSSKPLWTQIDEFIMSQREKNPEYIIDANIDCTDYELSIHPVYSINTVKLVSIFFDNIFKHSNANNITFKLNISQTSIDCTIQDNGTGINDNYLTTSPWYSSLHKAHEIVYLLNGNLTINGSITEGTSVRFGFSIEN